MHTLSDLYISGLKALQETDTGCVLSCNIKFRPCKKKGYEEFSTGFVFDRHEPDLNSFDKVQIRKLLGINVGGQDSRANRSPALCVRTNNS